MTRHGPTLLAFALALAHFASFDVVSQPIVTDVRYFLYYAWQVTEGAVPHLDFFENKPQLSTFAGALFFAAGDALGVDPLIAIRAGYLALASLGGVLVFAIFRRLASGSAVGGFLGLLAYCSFGLLGVLPSVGNIPKLLMAVLASAAALLVHDRRWFLAGACGALAFLDWQVGGLVFAATLISALLLESARRRAVTAVCAGGALAIAPFLAYYAWHGALGAAFDQVIVATFFRGSAALQSGGVLERLGRIAEMAASACPQQQWLFFASFLGLAVIARWLLAARDGERVGLLVPLCVYHGGVLAFSLVDFQLYGDLFLLLHSVAFLLGLAWLGLLAGGSDLVARLGSPGAARALPFVVLALAFAAGRPGPLRPGLEIQSAAIAPGGRLADQREVARAVAERTEGRSFALMDSSELLFLMRHRNPLPNVYWNRAVRSHFRRSPDEAPETTARRLLASVRFDVFIEPRVMRDRVDLVPGARRVVIASANAKYSVVLRVRPEGGG